MAEMCPGIRHIDLNCIGLRRGVRYKAVVVNAPELALAQVESIPLTVIGTQASLGGRHPLRAHRPPRLPLQWVAPRPRPASGYRLPEGLAAATGAP